MRNVILLKGMTMFLIGAGLLTYGCSQDDAFEQESDVRSLSKRAMDSRGECGEVDPNAVSAIRAGEWTERTISGKCTVRISWTSGYITGDRGPYAKLTATVTQCSAVNASNKRAYASWMGYYGVCGTVSYDYEVYVSYKDENGNTKYRWEKRHASDSFNFDPRPIKISHDELMGGQ